MASLTVTYKGLTGLEVPANQGLIRLNFDALKSSEIRSSEVTDSNLFLELAPENGEEATTIGWLKSLIQKPVIVSIIESVISKDKKGKETEKQTLLGQTSLDLLSFLVSGETRRSESVVLCSGWGKIQVIILCHRRQKNSLTTKKIRRRQKNFRRRQKNFRRWQKKFVDDKKKFRTRQKKIRRRQKIS